MTGYDPYTHARTLGISISFRPIATSHALWCEPAKLLVLRANMTAAEERSVLAAYIVHAESGSAEQIIPDEPAAIAAARLIDPVKLAASMSRSDDIAHWARELRVTTCLVEAFLGATRRSIAA